MKLYRTQHDAAPSEDGQTLGVRYHWQGTQADAAAARKKFRTDGLKHIETEEIEVPTSKADLIAWLNTHVKGE